MKDKKLQELADMTKELYAFDWLNLYKLSEKELDFLAGVLSAERVHRWVIEKVFAGKEQELEAVIDEVAKEKGLMVRPAYV